MGKVKDDFLSRTVHSVIRIETVGDDNTEYIGTAFLYFATPKNLKFKVAILVTNAHLIVKTKQVRLYFTRADDNNEPTAGVVPIILDYDETKWFLHPNRDVDLCAIEIGTIIEKSKKQGNPIFALVNSNNSLLTEDDLSNLEAVEELFIIGFPNGIYDEFNNRPIVRRGINASDLELDYKGFSEFLVDAALYTGSSGSPVFIYNKFFHKDGAGMVGGSKINFVGVIYSVLEISIEGEIINTLRPASKVPTIVRTNVSQQLSVAIKSFRVEELSQYFLVDYLIKLINNELLSSE